MKKSNINQGKKGQNSVNFASKPFCDCTSHCSCQPCRDVVKGVAIRKISSPKVAKPKKKTKDGKKPEPIKISSSITVPGIKKTSLLDVLLNDPGCTCETVARAVRSDVHKNLDMQPTRAEYSKNVKNKTIP